MQTLGTGLLVMLAGFWLFLGLRRVFRQVLWREHHKTLRDAETRLGGGVRPRKAGWEVRGPGGKLWLRTGLMGLRTDVWAPDGRHGRWSGPPTEATWAWLSS